MSSGSPDRQAMLQLEQQLPGLKTAYADALRDFLAIPQDGRHITQRRGALQAWHDAGVAYFNAWDRVIALGALCGADREPAWYTDRAESAGNVLDSVELHYRTLHARADELHLSRDVFKPSRTAYANLQRLVREADHDHAIELRARFVAAGLPTHGFDKPGQSKPGSNYSAALWEKVTAVAAAVVGVAVALFVVVRNEPFADPNLVVVLRTVLSLCAAILGAVVPGFLSVDLSRRGFAIRAGGALALFVITFFFSPAVIPRSADGRSADVPRPPADDLEVTDVSFVESEVEFRAPRLDVKLANRGTRTAFIKRVDVRVKRVWRLAEGLQTTGEVIPPGHNYVVRVKPEDAGGVVSLPLSRGVKPDDLDRFSIQFEEYPQARGNEIYLIDVEIVANGNDATCRRSELLFLITRYAPFFPDPVGFQGAVQDLRIAGQEPDVAALEKALAENKAIFGRIGAMPGTKSRGLLRFIEAATSPGR